MTKLNNEPELRFDTVQALASICGSWRDTPSSYMVQEEVKVSGLESVATEEFCNAWRGTLGSEVVRVNIMDQDTYDPQVKYYHSQTLYTADQC